MKVLWFLVVIQFSDWDGRLAQVHTISGFDTKEECVEAKSEMPKHKRFPIICTTQPQPDWKEKT